VAYGIGVDGIREVIGNDVVAGESLESWQTFLRGLKERGLRGVCDRGSVFRRVPLRAVAR